MLKHRLFSGFTIAAVLVLMTNTIPTVGAWLIIAVLAALGQFEFYTMMNKAGVPVFRVFGVISGTAMISATFCTIGPDAQDIALGYKWENLVLLATMLIVFIRQFPQKNNDKPIETIACTLLGIFYVPFLLNYFTRLLFAWSSACSTMKVSETGRMMIFYLVLVVKIADVGAYFTGRALGKHKLFPRISPKKTWEGLIGGLLASVIASVLFVYFSGQKLGVVSLPYFHAVILGFLLSIVGVVGDMFESLIKRAAGAKDSGTMVPGMGGLLDVLDSLLFGTPVLYVYARMILS